MGTAQMCNGSSEWWTAVQIRNHRNPVYRVEYRLADGTFKSIGREMYNYFVEPNGARMTTLTLRVTDIYGNTLTDSGIPILNDAGVDGGGQFPAAP
jgi:expansin (peptidoglycan-binding protein)